MSLPKSETVIDHPAYYKAGGIEAIDVIEAWDLSFNAGNAVKYISRAGRKDPATLIEDLHKAQWYLSREIARLGSLAKRFDSERFDPDNPPDVGRPGNR